MSTLSQTIPAQFFAARQAAGRFTVRGRDYEVELALPSLADADKSVWADWGPMCTCRLTAGATVSVTYREVESGKAARYTIAPPTVCLNSPPRADERRVHPYYLEVVDAARGVKLEIYLDHDARATRVEVSALHACLDFPALVFCEAGATAMAS